MNKKVVIFGPDNSGKTTLTLQLGKKYNLEIIKSLGIVPRNKQLKYMEEMTKKENIVFDRYPIIEETVCGKIFRNHSNFEGFENDTNIRKYLDKIDLFIFCNPGLESILNFGSREQMNGVKENIFELYNGYIIFYKWLFINKYNVIEYNWNLEKDGMKKIERRLMNNEY